MPKLFSVNAVIFFKFEFDSRSALPLSSSKKGNHFIQPLPLGHAAFIKKEYVFFSRLLYFTQIVQYVFLHVYLLLSRPRHYIFIMFNNPVIQPFRALSHDVFIVNHHNLTILFKQSYLIWFNFCYHSCIA